MDAEKENSLLQRFWNSSEGRRLQEADLNANRAKAKSLRTERDRKRTDHAKNVGPLREAHNAAREKLTKSLAQVARDEAEVASTQAALWNCSTRFESDLGAIDTELASLTDRTRLAAQREIWSAQVEKERREPCEHEERRTQFFSKVTGEAIVEHFSDRLSRERRLKVLTDLVVACDTKLLTSGLFGEELEQRLAEMSASIPGLQLEPKAGLF